MWKILQWIVEILLCEGVDIKQWLEPRNISWCLRLIYYLSTLSLFISCIVITCSYSYTCLILFMCPHLCSTKRALIAPQLLVQKNLEKQFQSLSRRIQAHSWLHIVCQQLSLSSALFIIRLLLHLFTPSRCTFNWYQSLRS